jgi:dTDP-4-amino-4,6-dideoxygalactose transaminase
MPAFTFVATAIAAEQCGYRPYLADIDAETWMLDPERLIGLPILAQIGLIIPVAPFGRPVPHQAWQLFRDKTGIPVVIDGAASFDRITEAPQQYMGTVPVALSFHATKGFGLGEGGGVASTDTGLMLRIVQALNFGFHRVREAEAAGINGKLSEYHAAVGLAELDGWQEKRLALQAVIDCYRRIMAGANLADRFIGAPEIGLSYALFRCRDPMEAGRVQEWLGRRGVDTRLWYGTGLHRQTYFANLSHERLDVTDLCAPCLIGLPMAPDLGEPQIIRITAALAEGLATAA